MLFRSNTVALSANGWANSVALSANGWANTVALSANGWANTVGLSANGWANTVALSANGWANQVATSANSWANTVGASGNAYANVVGLSSNNYAGVMSNASNTYANNTFLKLSGGTLSGDLSITGNLNIVGNTAFVNVTTYKVEDSLIYLADGNYSTDLVEIGFVANYSNGACTTVHTGLFRSPSSKEYYLFQGYDKEPANNYIDPTGNNITNAVLNADLITSNLALGGANAIIWLRSAYGTGNGAFTIANAAFDKANVGGANVANVAPTSPTSGQLWWNKDLGRLYIYYADSNSSQWVEASPSSPTIEGSVITGYINPVYDIANAAFIVANSAYAAQNADYTSSNAAYTVANAAFGKANTALQNTTGTFAGDLTATGLIKSTSAPGFLAQNGTTTGSNAYRIINNNGSFYLGTENSAGTDYNRSEEHTSELQSH